MRIHKRTKFPIEITKGKAEDMYRMRFMRKSEVGPNVRHNLKFYACQMGRQLEIWFKEQSFTIGYLAKEQEKLHRSQVRLHRASRQAKRQIYATQQELVREKLEKIRLKLMMMKVVQRFKQNVRVNKAAKESSFCLPKSRDSQNLDTLQISGSKQLIYDKHELPDFEPARHRNQADGDVDVSGFLHANCTTWKNDKQSNTRKDASVSKTVVTNARRIGKSTAVADDDCGDDDSECESFTVSKNTAQDNTDNGGLGGECRDWETAEDRFSLDHGSWRMETIPEETHTEIEMEAEVPRLQGCLTKYQLNLLSRSQSKRNVFDTKDHVTLLPDVHNTHAPDRRKITKERGTQTSSDTFNGSRRNRRKGAVSKDRTGQKAYGRTRSIKSQPTSIVVKIPVATPREDSAKSNQGNFGSESDSDIDDGSNQDYGNGLDSVVSASCSECSDDSDEGISRSYPDEFALTLAKYKTTLRPVDDGSRYGTYIQTLPTITNLSADLPDVQYFHVQNPFSLQYKERSFFINASDSDRPVGSARHKNRHRSSAGGVSPEGRGKQTHNAIDHRTCGKKFDLSTEFEKGCAVIMDGRTADIQVFGRKPDGVKSDLPTPPNTPTRRNRGMPKRKEERPRLNQLLLEKKKSKLAEMERRYKGLVDEHVPKYERTKSGKIKPLGETVPRTHAVPSSKEIYFRDKLLKKERDNIFNQNMKMKRFIHTFDSERSMAELPPLTNGPTCKPSSAKHTEKTFSSLLFKVHQPTDQEYSTQEKVVPSVSTTSLQLLKNCRYLRQYQPISEDESMTSLVEKASSWNLKSSSNNYAGYDYVGNIRVNLYQ